MAQVKYDKVQIEIFKTTPIGRAYLEYNEKVGAFWLLYRNGFRGGY